MRRLLPLSKEPAWEVYKEPEPVSIHLDEADVEVPQADLPKPANIYANENPSARTIAYLLARNNPEVTHMLRSTVQYMDELEANSNGSSAGGMEGIFSLLNGNRNGGGINPLTLLPMLQGLNGNRNGGMNPLALLPMLQGQNSNPKGGMDPMMLLNLMNSMGSKRHVGQSQNQGSMDPTALLPLISALGNQQGGKQGMDPMALMSMMSAMNGNSSQPGMDPNMLMNMMNTLRG